MSGFRGAQAAREVFDQVVWILQADRETHRAGPDSGAEEVRVAHAEVRGARRVDHQRLGVADVREVREDPQGIDEAPAGFAAAREIEAEYRAATPRQELLRERAVRMRIELRIRDRRHLRPPREK